MVKSNQFNWGSTPDSLNDAPTGAEDHPPDRTANLFGIDDDATYLRKRVQEKQAERQALLAMEPEEAQILVNQSLGSGQWQPEIRVEIWDDEFIDWYDESDP
jgi:hypothetical protein